MNENKFLEDELVEIISNSTYALNTTYIIKHLWIFLVLITGKGGQKHEIGEFIIYGSGPDINFLRIYGKLYLYCIDHNDSYDQHF